MLEGFYAGFFARFLFIADVNMRPRIVSDQDHGQPWSQAPTALQPVYFLFNLILNFFSDGLAIDNSGHEWTPECWRKLYPKQDLRKELFAIFG